jgi:hypothetical protein
VEAVQSRLLKIDELLVTADPLARLHLTQERIDLHAEMVRLANGELDLSSLEKDFVRVAKTYGEQTGVTYAAWRQVGVDTEVLDQAGVVRVPPSRPDASRSKRPPQDAPVAAIDDPVGEIEVPALVLEPPAPEPLFEEAPAPKAKTASAAPPADDGSAVAAPKKVRRKRIADAPSGDAAS